MTPIRWSVIVPVRNKASVLGAVLESLTALVAGRADAELIVVDHASTDGSSAILRGYADRARIVNVAGGTAALARNCGASTASGEFLCFVDADVVLPPDYLDRLAAVLARTGAPAAGCTVTVPASAGWIARTWDQLHAPSEDGWRTWLAAANFAVRREAFNRVGGFDVRLVTGEDAELCARLTQAGVRIFESRRLVGEHLDNPDSLAAFFQKERWRGLGMFGTVGKGRLDRPTAMTAAHLVLLVAAVIGAATLPPMAALVAAPALALAAPALTVAYRRARNGSRAPIAASLVLYELYYLARLAALGQLALGRVRRRRPGL